MLAGFEGPKGPSQPGDHVPVYLAGFAESKAPRVGCIMTSLATTVISHENAPNIEFSHASLQCLKSMVVQSPLATKNWAGPIKFDPGQVKITIDYIRREIFWTFLGD